MKSTVCSVGLSGPLSSVVFDEGVCEGAGDVGLGAGETAAAADVFSTTVLPDVALFQLSQISQRSTSNPTRAKTVRKRIAPFDAGCLNMMLPGATRMTRLAAMAFSRVCLRLASVAVRAARSTSVSWSHAARSN